MNNRIHLWNQKMLRIVNAKDRVVNNHGFKFEHGKTYIIMSNHLSLYDIPLIFAAFPGESVRMLAKKELYKIPFFGWGIKASECVSIDRINYRKAVFDLKIAKQKIQSGIRLWIAPEGSRSRSGALMQFKKGGFKLAIDTKSIIVPVTIVGSNKILPPDTFDFSINENIKIYIGKPINACDYDKKSINKLIDATYCEISKNYQA